MSQEPKTNEEILKREIGRLRELSHHFIMHDSETLRGLGEILDDIAKGLEKIDPTGGAKAEDLLEDIDNAVNAAWAV